MSDVADYARSEGAEGVPMHYKLGNDAADRMAKEAAWEHPISRRLSMTILIAHSTKRHHIAIHPAIPFTHTLIAIAEDFVRLSHAAPPPPKTVRPR